MTWYGWIHKDGRWQRVASGPTLDEASKALSTYLRQKRLRVEDVDTGLTPGAPPTWKRPIPARSVPASG